MATIFVESQIPGCKNSWKNSREKRLLTTGKNANRITEYHACFCGKRRSVFIGLTSSPGETDCSVTRAAGPAANEWATVQGHGLQQIERAPDSPLSFFPAPLPLNYELKRSLPLTRDSYQNCNVFTRREKGWTIDTNISSNISSR